MTIETELIASIDFSEIIDSFFLMQGQAGRLHLIFLIKLCN